jgi:hypothetical protein
VVSQMEELIKLEIKTVTRSVSEAHSSGLAYASGYDENGNLTSTHNR